MNIKARIREWLVGRLEKLDAKARRIIDDEEKSSIIDIAGLVDILVCVYVVVYVFKTLFEKVVPSEYRAIRKRSHLFFW